MSTWRKVRLCLWVAAMLGLLAAGAYGWWIGPSELSQNTYLMGEPKSIDPFRRMEIDVFWYSPWQH